jgi:hypothetical protein
MVYTAKVDNAGDANSLGSQVQVVAPKGRAVALINVIATNLQEGLEEYSW